MFRSYYWYRLRVLLLITAVLLTQSGVVVAATESTSSAVQFLPALSIVSETQSATESPILTPLPIDSSFASDHTETSSSSGILLQDIPRANPLSLRDLTPKTTRTKLKRKTRINSTLKRYYRMNEPVKLDIAYGDETTSIQVVNEKNELVDLPVTKKIDGDNVETELSPPQQLKPGKYTLIIRDGSGLIYTQDFTWGVLAINTNKAVYAPDETATIAIAVLNEQGATLCDAAITLTITTPSGEQSTLSTDNNSITPNSDCGSLRADASPDYETSFKVTSEGTYSLLLEATTANGLYSITDELHVQSTIPFRIERSGPTRIYPPNTYGMTMKVTATENFVGTIMETVPKSFTITQHPHATSYTAVDITSPYINESSQKLSLGFPVSLPTDVVRGFGDTIDSDQQDMYTQGGVIAHDGIDLAVPMGTDVQSIDNGEVIFSGESVYGTTVVVEHAWGRSYYGNLSSSIVSSNDHITKGQSIGTSGPALSDTPPHVHIGIKRKRNDFQNGFAGKENPVPYLGKTSLLSDISVKTISWNVSLAKGESITLGYAFLAPRISPQFYLLGPLRFFNNTQALSDIKNTLTDISDRLATSSAIDSESTSSASLQPSSAGSDSLEILNTIRHAQGKQVQNDEKKISSPLIHKSSSSAQLTPLRQDFVGQATDNEATPTGLLIPVRLDSTDVESSTSSANFLLPTSNFSQPTTHNSPFDSTQGKQPTTTLDFTDFSLRMMTTLPSRLAYEEPRSWQIAADAIPNNARASTVEFFAGAYSGNGSTGQNSDTNQTFSTFNFNLAETNVTIQQAYILFEAQFGAYANPPAYTGWSIAFDACEETCTANAWSGTGAVTVSDTSTLAYNESESMGVRFLADVTSETTLAAYTGDGTNLEGQVGYSIDDGSAGNSIAQAKAKLVLTYTYGANSTSYTNTVVYPLESTASGDQGTRNSSQTGGCTKNSNCPTFDYTVTLGESSPTQVSQWFQTDYYNDGNSNTDIVQNVNIEGDDTDSSDNRLEAANGGGQGNGFQSYFSSVSGYAVNTAQQLEIYHSTGTIYTIGGEVFHTYTAPVSESSKTRTVRYPLGVLSDGNSTSKFSASTTVYFPEIGVNVEKAWIRYASSADANSNMTITATTTVGGNTESGGIAYAFNSPSSVPFGSFLIYHVIPSSDYTELETANGSTGVSVTASAQANSTSVRGISAELVITYTYSAEYQGYMSTNTIIATQQTSNPSQSHSTSAGAIDPYLPELNGVLTARGAQYFSVLLESDSDGSAGSGPILTDADMVVSGDTCSTTDAHRLNIDAINSYVFWYQDVSTNFTADDTDTYTGCWSNDGAADTSGGAKQNAVLIYTYQVTLPALSQLMRHGKWFDSNGTYQAFTF